MDWSWYGLRELRVCVCTWCEHAPCVLRPYSSHLQLGSGVPAPRPFRPWMCTQGRVGAQRKPRVPLLHGRLAASPPRCTEGPRE